MKVAERFLCHKGLLLWVLVLFAVAVVMLNIEQDFLWKTQQLNLFLHTSLFFSDHLRVAGGLLVWLCTWLTSLLYHPVLGVGVLCGLWLLLLWLTRRAFRLSGRWSVALLIPVALLLLTIVDMGYWVYILKLRGHFFVATVGSIGVVALLWAFRLVCTKSPFRRHWVWPLCFVVLTCAVGYPLMGIYGLAATLLMGLWVWRLRSAGVADPEAGWGGALACSVAAVVSVLAVPLLCYRYVYCTTNLQNIYWVDLPLYYTTARHAVFYLPYYLLAAFFVMLTLKKCCVEAEKTAKAKRSFCLQTALLGVLVAGVVVFWYRDANFHRELAMQHALARQDWQGVLDEAARQTDEPTRAIVMMRNIALARLGQQGERMYHYRNGSKPMNAPFAIRTMQVVGPLVYYHYGQLNYCPRLCMELGVEYGWRAEHYQLMARCALLNGETALARKYIALLKQTPFFGAWTADMEPLLARVQAGQHPQELLERHPEMGFITHMMHYADKLGGDQGMVEPFLMRQLSASTYAADPIFQEQTLLASMWTGDVDAFWRHFADYNRLHPNGQPPTHYQEAALLFGSLEGRPDMDRWPFAPAVRESYRRFDEIAPRYDDMEVEAVRKALYPLFGQTFYYDYFLMSDLPQD